MRIEDASDRVYAGKITSLLKKARRQGVEVTLCLNTKLESQSAADVGKGPCFDRLREAGVVIHLIPPVRRLHDKLIVLNRRFVVEGSTNLLNVLLEERTYRRTLQGRKPVPAPL